jgi:hypothetical protein
MQTVAKQSDIVSNGERKKRLIIVFSEAGAQTGTVSNA